MDVFVDITQVILDFGLNIFNFIFLPLPEFLQEAGPFGEFLYDIIAWGEGVDFFSGFTLSALLFSVGALAWCVIYFFIP